MRKLRERVILPSRPFDYQLWLDHLAFAPGGEGLMTSIDSHRIRASVRVNVKPTKSPGDLTKADIVHIAPGDPMTNIVQQRMIFGSCAASLSLAPDIK